MGPTGSSAKACVPLQDDLVLIPLAVRFLLNRLPPALRAEIARQPTA